MPHAESEKEKAASTSRENVEAYSPAKGFANSRGHLKTLEFEISKGQKTNHSEIKVGKPQVVCQRFSFSEVSAVGRIPKRTAYAMVFRYSIPI